MDADSYFSPDGYESLLDSSGQAELDGERPENAALALLAAAIHRAGPELNAKQLEQAARWLKDWKFEKQPPVRRETYGPGGFYNFVGEIRDSAEQGLLHNQAFQTARAAHGWAALAGAAVCFGVMNFVINYSYWFFSLAAFVLAWWTYRWKCLPTARRAALVWKEQEQRNLFTAVRSAETLVQSNLAGLFAWVPEAQMGAEVERIRDALYRDPDGWADSLSR
jgi:hypothetical protein